MCGQHLQVQKAAAKRSRNVGGRPTKLTREVENQIVEILSLGGYAETAALAAGIAKRTYQEWISRGDPEGTAKKDEPYRQFRERIEQATASVAQSQAAIINRAASHDWKAAAWMLERTQPDKYAGPRGRRLTSSIHPDDFANGEDSSGMLVADDQLGPDGRPL